MSGGESTVRSGSREDIPLYGRRQRFSQTREFRKIGGAMRAAEEALRPTMPADAFVRFDVNDYANRFRDVTGFTPLARHPSANAFADSLFGWASNRPGVRGATSAERSRNALDVYETYLRVHVPPRLVVILRERLAERFNRFADSFHRTATALKDSEDPADQREEIRLLTLSAQSRAIVHALYNNGVDFRNLQLLDQVMKMMFDARTADIGDGLILLVSKDNEGRLRFPDRFGSLVSLALSQGEAITEWRSELVNHFGDNRVQKYMSRWGGENGIAAGVTNWFLIQGGDVINIFSRLMRQAPRAVRRSAAVQADISILALLEMGEAGLAQKFLATIDTYNEILQTAGYTSAKLSRALHLRDVVYGLMNTAVSQREMTYERRNLLERSLELMKNGGTLVSGFRGEVIPQMVIALLGYRQLDPAVERQLVGLFDELLNPFSGVILEMWQTEIETGTSTMRTLVVGVLKDLLYMQREIGKAALPEDQQQYLFSNSVAAKVLSIAQTHKLNAARIIMMINALDAHERGNQTEAEYYMKPLQDSSADIQTWIDNLSGVTFETIDVALEERYYSLTETTFGGTTPAASGSSAPPAPEAPPAPAAPAEGAENGASSVTGLAETGETSGSSVASGANPAGHVARAGRSGSRRSVHADVNRQIIRPRRELQTFRPVAVARPVVPTRVR